MLIIVKDGELTEKKKLEAYKYSGLFKVMNKISKLIQELEQIDQYLSYGDEENIRIDTVRKLEKILDRVSEEIEYARVHYRKDQPFWKTGDMSQLGFINNRKHKKG